MQQDTPVGECLEALKMIAALIYIACFMVLIWAVGRLSAGRQIGALFAVVILSGMGTNYSRADEWTHGQMQLNHYPVYQDSIMAAKCVERGFLMRSDFEKAYYRIRSIDPMATMTTAAGEHVAKQYMGDAQYFRLNAETRAFTGLTRDQQYLYCQEVRERNRSPLPVR